MSDHLPPMPTCRYCGTPADECEEGHAERCKEVDRANRIGANMTIGDINRARDVLSKNPQRRWISMRQLHKARIDEQARYENEYKTGDPGEPDEPEEMTSIYMGDLEPGDGVWYTGDDGKDTKIKEIITRDFTEQARKDMEDLWACCSCGAEFNGHNHDCARVLYPVPISLTRYLATLAALLLAVAAFGYILGGM